MSDDTTTSPDLASKLKTVKELADSDEVGLKTEVPWTQDSSALPAGSKHALEENIELSKACAGVTGTSIDPRTGDVVPTHNLCMRHLARRRQAKQVSD